MAAKNTHNQAAPESIDIDPFAITGTSGLRQFQGMIDEEWHNQLKGKSGVRFYREMSDNCAVIGAFLFAMEMFIRNVEWRVSPANESEAGIAAATFLEECIDDMSITWEDFIAEIFTMLPFGWSYFEEIYKRRIGPDEEDPERRSNFTDGRIGWRKIAIRAQETLWRWELDTDGGIRGMWQWDPFAHGKGLVFLPIEKALLFRTKSNKNNPEGRSVLRNAWRSWKFVRRHQEIEAIGIERDLAGYPVMEVPLQLLKKNPTAGDAALRTVFEKLIQNVRRDEREGALVPPEVDINGKPTGYKLKLLTTGGRRAIDIGKVIERYEHRILSVVLHDWILLGQQQVGSFALADSKTEASTLATSGYLRIVRSVMNRIAIPRLYRLNPEFQRENWATIEHGDIEIPNLTAIGDYIFKMIGSGALTPDAELERYIRQTGSLPDRSEDLDTTILNATPPRPKGKDGKEEEVVIAPTKPEEKEEGSSGIDEAGLNGGAKQ